MITRDDFSKLDKYSFGQCLTILDKHAEKRAEVEKILDMLDVELTEEIFDALDLLLEQLAQNQSVKLQRSILRQIKKEKFQSEAD